MRRVRTTLLLLGLCALATVTLGSNDSSPQLVRVTPTKTDGLLTCRLQTLGLPGEKQLQSMRSGLISAIELDLALVDEDENTLSGNSLTLSFGFELWEEVFSVRQDTLEHRFNTLAAMQDYLADLKGLAVAPASSLTNNGRYRLRVDLIVHAIAPAEQERVEDVIVGDQRPQLEGRHQQEASVSLGHLIRLFYKGGRQGREGQMMMSQWFRPKEVQDETH